MSAVTAPVSAAERLESATADEVLAFITDELGIT
jgi:hypothetical protein